MTKKQIKVIFIFILMMFFTGCNAEYNLNISNDNIVESTNFYIEDDDLASTNSPFSSLDEMADYYFLQDYAIFYSDAINNAFYEKNKISDNGKYGINLTHTYSFKKFNDSYLLNYKYIDKNYKVGKKTITIDINNFSSFYKHEVGDDFNNLNFNNLTINIKTNLKVLENNADSVNGNVYTWNINKDNSSVKRVYIKVKKGSDYFSMFIDIGIVIGFVIVIVLLVFLVKKKIAKNNEI